MDSPPPELEIRRYRSGDHDSVRALHDLALHDVGAHLGNGRWDEDLDAIEDVYLSSGGEFLVGTLGREIVVMGALRRTGPRDAVVTRMRVTPRLQGHGHGTQMLLRLEARARELGVTRLRLDTTTRQLAAQALYRNHGFRLAGTGHEGPFEVIYFEKSLVDAER
jgi:GNAT superfamily N-acetyltransferase